MQKVYLSIIFEIYYIVNAIIWLCEIQKVIPRAVFHQRGAIPCVVTAQASSHQDKILHFFRCDIPPKGNTRCLHRGKFQVSGKRMDIY